MLAAWTAVSCSDDPRRPVEEMLDRARQGLSTDDCWASPRTLVGKELESWEAGEATTENARKLEDLEADIVRKEQAVPIIQGWLSEATERGLRGHDGMGPARKLEEGLDALRSDIDADKQRKLELIEKLDEGSTWLRYTLLIRGADGGTSRKEYLFRVDAVGDTFLITEARDLGVRERAAESPERIARRYASGAPRH